MAEGTANNPPGRVEWDEELSQTNVVSEVTAEDFNQGVLDLESIDVAWANKSKMAKWISIIIILSVFTLIQKI